MDKFLKSANEVAKGYVSQKQRNNTPKENFGDPEREKYPVNNEQEFRAAVHLLGKAPAERQAGIKRRLMKIAKREGYSLPSSWEKDSK